MRAVPGGYDIDRWPITVPLGAGESLPGWLMRVGLRYQLTPMQLLRELRVLHRPTGYDRVLERLRPHTGHIAAHLGVPADDLLAAAPTGALEAALARHLVYYRHTRARPAGSRYCPACLAEPDPRWRTDWANPLLPLCLRHDIHLPSHCPGCAQVPWSGTAWLSARTQPWQCPQRRPRDPARPQRTMTAFCRHDLREIPTITVTDPKLLTAQRYLLALALVADRRPNRRLRHGTTDLPLTEVLDKLCRRIADTLNLDPLLDRKPDQAPAQDRRRAGTDDAADAPYPRCSTG